MTENNVEKLHIDQLFDLVRNSSASSMKYLIKASDNELITRDLTDTEDLSYDHWICCIVVKFSGLSVIFSVHFTSRIARQLAGIGTGIKMDELSPRVTHDFMREFCNLTAGTIKDKLRKCNFENPDTTATMLPTQEPSFDTAKLGPTDSQWLMNWFLCHKGQDALICSGKIEVENAKVLSKLSKINDPTILIDDSGEIDFL
jgi:hypothetical protein